VGWQDFQQQIWPWMWPSLILLAWAVVTYVGLKWASNIRRFAVLGDQTHGRIVRWLSVLCVVLGLAMWIEFTPLLPHDSKATWQAIWPWLWPSFILGLLIGLSVMITRWFLTGLGAGLAQGAQQAMGKETVRKVAYALMAGALVASVLIWIWLVPAPDAVMRTMTGRVLPWLIPSLVLIAWIATGLVASRGLVSWLSERAASTKNSLDDTIIATMRRPLWLIVILTGIQLWAGLAPLPAALDRTVDVGTKAASVFLIVMFADGFVQAWLQSRAGQSKILATSGGVLRTAAKILVYVIGILMVLSSVGIDVTPLLASLGVGSLALGLALQKTLEDFLAGLFLAADQPIRVGDYVELANGEGGTVLTIGWRTTRLRSRLDSHIIVPNSQLATSTVVNRSMPRSDVSFTVTVGVDYASDLAEVTKVSLAVAQEVHEEQTVADSNYQPRVVFEQFGESSVDFQVWLRAISWEGHFKLKDAFIRKLHERFKVEGISIPFPIRTLDIPEGTRLETTKL
jgi:small-conductance mechanosensitive channel